MKRWNLSILIAAMVTSYGTYAFYAQKAYAETPVSYSSPEYGYESSSWTVAGASLTFSGSDLGYRLSVQGGTAEFKIKVGEGSEGDSIFVKAGEPIERSLRHTSHKVTIKLESLSSGSTGFAFADGVTK